MDKVLSAIKSLECVAILQVNVKEGTPEVVHSGHGGSASGSASVKNEDIEETDACSKNAAEDPMKDHRLEIDEENREPPAHTGNSSARKRKRKSSVVASDASTTLPKIRKKVKTDKDTSTTQKSKTIFDEWCNRLLRFKEEFGHCNVPQKYSKYSGKPSLGIWCNDARSAYTKIQKGMKPRRNLSQERIERLEEIGFQWQVVDYDEAFKKRCRDLISFKEEFGHCNVPIKNNPSLGKWCNKMSNAYKKIQKGMKAHYNLSQDRIERLEEIGFQWNLKNTKMLHACATLNV